MRRRWAAPAQTSPLTPCDERPSAGPAGNAARVARSRGADARVVGRVGRDLAADLVRRTLEREGVDARLAGDELPTGTAVALADSVVADRGANARFSPEDVPSPLHG